MRLCRACFARVCRRFRPPCRDRSTRVSAPSRRSTWARSEVDLGNINPLVKLDVTQSADLPLKRRVSLGIYMLAGSIVFLTLAVFVVLFINRGPGTQKNDGDLS